jgi:hypothetical protein
MIGEMAPFASLRVTCDRWWPGQTLVTLSEAKGAMLPVVTFAALSP